MDNLKKSLKDTINKNIITKKNIVIFFVAIILAIFMLLTFSVSTFSNNKDTIKVSVSANDTINSINVSRNNLSLNKFENSNLSLVNEDGSVKLLCNSDTEFTYQISVIDNFSINFKKVSNNTKVYINDTQIDINNNSATIVRDKVGIVKESISNLSGIYIFLIIFISFVILFMMLSLMVSIINKIKNDKVRLLDIILLCICTFLIYFTNVYILMFFNRLIAIIPAFILGVTFIILLRNSNKNWHNIFLCVSVIFGMMFLFIVPPGNVPDEPSHYIRAYADSDFFADKENGIKLPVNINSLFDKFTHDVHSQTAKFSGASYLTELTKSGDYSNVSQTPTMYENTKYLSFIPYLPATIVNFIGRICNVSVLTLFLLSRLSNFCVSTTLCYFAIKLTPRFKKLFVLVGLLPIFLQQAIGVDMDYLTNSIAFMLLALIFRYTYEKTSVEIKDMLYLMLTALALGTCKFGYFPLLFLILMVQNNKFKNKKVAIIFKAIIILAPIILSCLFNFGSVSAPNTKTDYYTIETVLKNPINSIIICIRTLITRFDLDTFRGLIDGFGWSTKYNPPLVLWTIASIYIIMLFVDDEENNNLKIKDRIAMLLVWGIIYAILYAIAFTEWTRIELNVINGLQSRYFIPILILFFAAISNNLIKLNVKNKYNFYYILLNIVQISAVASLLVGFY